MARFSAVFTPGAEKFLVTLGQNCPKDVDAQDQQYEVVSFLVNRVTYVSWLSEPLDERNLVKIIQENCPKQRNRLEYRHTWCESQADRNVVQELRVLCFHGLDRAYFEFEVFSFHLDVAQGVLHGF